MVPHLPSLNIFVLEFWERSDFFLQFDISRTSSLSAIRLIFWDQHFDFFCILDHLWIWILWQHQFSMFLDCDLLKISILFVIWSWLFEISIVAPIWSWIFVCKSTVSLWVPFVFNWDSFSNSFEVQLFSSFRLAAAASRIFQNIFPRISVVLVFPSTFFHFFDLRRP